MALLAAISLEAAAVMVFAAEVICGSLLTCCCLSRCRDKTNKTKQNNKHERDGHPTYGFLHPVLDISLLQ